MSSESALLISPPSQLGLQASSPTADLKVTSRTLQGEDRKTKKPEDTAALGFGGRLEFLLWAGLSPNLFPLEFLFCLDVGELQ